MNLWEQYKLTVAKDKYPIVFEGNRYVCHGTICRTYERAQHQQFNSARLVPKEMGCKCWECKPTEVQ